jgi:hypothetical protein
LVINNGGINNGGTFTSGTGTVLLTGTSGTSSLGGTSPLSFYNLGINKTTGTGLLLKNVSISNSLLLTTGNIDLNGFTLDLGTTGSIVGESATSTVVGSLGGTVNRTVNLNAPNSFNPGNIGIEITSAANLGLTTIKRGQSQQVNSSGYSINRYFDIIPTNNTGLNATLKFYYQDAELAGINETELKVWSKPVASNVLWTLLGSTAQDITANWVSKTGIDSLNMFTLASNVSHSLPVQFISFSGLLLNNGVQLNWSTLTEINSKSFEVEKAYDGSNFSRIGTVAAAGNSNSVRTYSLQDGAAFIAPAYYRLKLINKDGSFSYSSIILISKGNINNSFVSVYPNPTYGKVQLRFTSNSIGSAQLQISNASGVLFTNKTVEVLKGINTVDDDISRLPQGIYYFKLLGIDTKTIQVIKY